MTIFDLLFLAFFFGCVGTLLVAAIFAIRGRGARALRILRTYGICAAIYLGVVALTSLFWPRRVLNVGHPRCFDDWCMAVENVSRTSGRGNVCYVVTLQLSSRARRVSQRENGVVVYLTDDRGRRYDSAADKSAVPFSVMLRPGESITTARVFEVPIDAHELGPVISHKGGFPIPSAGLSSVMRLGFISRPSHGFRDETWEGG